MSIDVHEYSSYQLATAIMSVVDKIHHYQRNIEKCSDNEDRMLHCISKLSNLPVTVQHLQVTGVGRTVNALRKYKNGVGDAAKALVAKWKAMVVNEESSEGEDEDEACVPDAPESYTNSPESPAPEEAVPDHRQKNIEVKHEQKHKSVKTESSYSMKSSSKQESKTKVNQSHDTDEDTVKASTSESERIRKHDKSKHTHKHDSKSERRPHSKDSQNGKSTLKRDEDGESKSHNYSTDNTEKNSVKYSDGSKEHKLSRSAEESHKKRKNEGCSSPKKDSKRMKNSESEAEESKTNTMFATVKIKEEPKDKDTKHEVKHDKRDTSEKSKNSSSKHKSEASGSSKTKEHDERHKHKSEKKESRKDESYHSKKETSEIKSHSSSSSKHYEKAKDSSKKKEYKHDKSKHDGKSKGEALDPKRKESKEGIKVKQEFAGDEGIDCNSGTSFAEALGMCTINPSSRKRKDNSPNLNVAKNMKTEQTTSSVAPSKKQLVVKTEQMSGDDLHAPSLLAPNVKLEPLNVDLAATLPEISPNYKPLPYINPLHRREEDKMLTDVIYVKTQRTKVYSGHKTGYTTVPTLFELCIRILIENIDALEFTGGVPFDIIKPVLERASPEQLFLLEHYNPYLIDDTDPLWQFHCNRKFRGKERLEMESWREMYMRCLDENEAKLKSITATIKQSADKALPVRSTKLAYVDNVVKPPRNVLRKQAKYGTANAAPAPASSLKKKLIAGGGPTSATNVVVPAPAPARIRIASGVTKKTKAPLMAKALQLIKGRYKR